MEFAQHASIRGPKFGPRKGHPRSDGGFVPSEEVEGFESVPPNSKPGTDFA